MPDELSTIVNLRKAPPAPFLPGRLHGLSVVIIAVCYAGHISEGEQVLAPLRGFSKPLIDLIRPTPYSTHQGMFDASVPHGLHYYWKSDYLGELSDTAIEILVNHAWRALSPKSYTIIFQLGGATRRLGDDATAFDGRRAHHPLNIHAVRCARIRPAYPLTRDFWEAIHPVSNGGVYVNFLGNEGEERVRAAYGAAKYARLVALNNRYDPTNLFCLNQNIKPTG